MKLIYIHGLIILLEILARDIDSNVFVDAAATNSDEFDFNILDPLSAFGTPYGGWSRATRSRLEGLPLFLSFREESIREESFREEGGENDASVVYIQIRSSDGQLYACRTYQEDELDPSSLHDGMFEPPRMKPKTSASHHHAQEANSLMKNKESHHSHGDSDNSDKDELDNLPDEFAGRRVPDFSIEMSEIPVTIGRDESALADDLEFQQLVKLDGVDSISQQGIMQVLAINARLGLLNGFCGHIHLGWWSYEWCFEQHVTQFHITLEKEVLKASDFTNLGEYQSRKIDTDLSHLPKNQLAQDEVELGRVVESYVGGDVCPETNKPRSSTVHLVCCGEETMTKLKSMNKLVTDGNSDDKTGREAWKAAIHGVHEREVCAYDIVVCTNILCGDQSDSSTTENVRILSGTRVNPFSKTRPTKENESIRQVLDRTLGGVCLRTATAGWWTYELCHGNEIRQFHDEIGTRTTSKGTTVTSRIVEAEHILGKYPQETAESFPDEDEYLHVVNATVTDNSLDKGGSGAYFQVEYIDGNVCDESEVTDRAIVAGASASNKISRSASVRYYCGSTFTLSVSEDSTCHYIADVTIPDLCDHPLFRAPAVMKQVMKCLPVDG